MKHLLLLLIAGALLVPLRADDYFTQGDFSQGAAGWKGNFQFAPPAPGATGLVVQLRPHDWTWLSQDIDPKHQQMKFEIHYELSPDAVLSSDPNEYKALGAQIGDAARRINLPRTGVAMILETNVDQKHLDTLPFILKSGTRRTEYVQNNHWPLEAYQEEGETETVTIALPPGTGTVTLSKIIGKSKDPSTPNTGFAPVQPGPPQDDYIQNGDFSQGTTGWGGQFQIAPPPSAPAPNTPQPNPPPPPAPEGGLVIQLKPHEWTTLTQDIVIKGHKMDLHGDFIFASNATYSKDPADYEGISQKIGLPDWSDAIKMLTPQAGGTLQGKCLLILTGQDKSENEYFLYRPQWGYERSQRGNFAFQFGTKDNKRTFMLALPPGTGTVAIRSLKGNGMANDINPQLPPKPGAPGNWAVDGVPPAPEDELVKNGDFSNGLTDWQGDLKPYTDMTPTEGVTLPVAPPPQTGAYFDLRKTSWVKLSQTINAVSPWVKMSIVYAYSSDVTYSQFPSDYENMFASVGMNGAQTGVPGGGSYFIEDPDTHRSSYSMFFPQRKGTSIRIDTTYLNVPNRMGQGRVTIALGLPPGKGIVTIYRISVVPSASPFEENTNGQVPAPQPKDN